EDNIHSATGDGKAPFVFAEDIVAVAFRALVDLQSHNTHHFICGLELLALPKYSLVLGRKIIHVELTQLEMANLFTEIMSMPREYADMLALMDVQIATGVEVDNAVLKITGRLPIRF
ncbi:hypothetical protein IW262DRAFT_1230187, partial [Armillaria fumosa]